MSILYGLKCVSQNGAANIPFAFGFNIARSVANDTLFELWNAPTNAGIKWAVDKDGKMYSAALAAGDLVTAVVGGVANVRRLDSLAIGGAATYLRSTGAVAAWATINATEITTGNLPQAQLPSGNVVWAQTSVSFGNVQVNVGNTAAIVVDGTDGTISAGVVGIAENNGALFLSSRGSVQVLLDNDNDSGAQTFDVRTNTTGLAGTLLLRVAEDASVTFAGPVTGVTTLSMSGVLTMTAATSQIVPGVTSFAIRDNANANNNILVSNAGLLTVRAGITVTGGATTLGGDLKFSTTQNIVAGAGSLNIRNNADNANNIAITDAGVVTIRAGLTLTAGVFTFGAAASQIVPGATSFAIRDTANANDNLLVSNAGVVTARAGLTVTAGNATITAGNLVFGATSALIIPGATDLTFRNNANNATNLQISDSGLVTIRNGLSVMLGDFNVVLGNIVMGTAATKLIPGATSFSLRNNADSADNILISNAGAVTFRGALSGATTLSLAGPITLTTAASRIIPGATSLTLSNNANNADNLVVTDAGLVSLRNKLTITKNSPQLTLAFDGSNFCDLSVGSTGSLSFSITTASAAEFVFTESINLNAAKVLKIASTQVVGPRVTGYSAMTGTPNKATVYDTATVTLAQLAGRVMQLQADWTTHGGIGA